ncbi:hypothetical protein E2493_02865 [Sphingomonas parva]|uniref:Uncharacterized protein n=1 Tax=Sphingomonas parva TaxID=2555898 RepID=A0A4Y8ZV53_9SPHN|nr:hypothetical protein [Sphingomonas parva]TFI59794.1 hypothetical protein E2493_02865 [Sphingomonas parva]
MPIDPDAPKDQAGGASPEDEIEYFQARAEQELELAQKANAPEVVAAHFEMASEYLERVAALQRAIDDDHSQHS